MDLNHFLEEDIRTFLDHEGEKQKHSQQKHETDIFSITKDYEGETERALDEHNIARARELFEQAKKQYRNAQEGTKEKEQLKQILASLQEKAGEYMKEARTTKDMFRELEAIESGKAESTNLTVDVFSGSPSMPAETMPLTTESEPVRQVVKEPTKEVIIEKEPPKEIAKETIIEKEVEIKKDEHENEIQRLKTIKNHQEERIKKLQAQIEEEKNNKPKAIIKPAKEKISIEEVESLVEEGRTKEAITKYKKLKHNFETQHFTNKEEKELRKQVLIELYKRIKLEIEVKEKIPETTEEKQEDNSTINLIEEIKIAVKEKQVQKAEENLLELRQKLNLQEHPEYKPLLDKIKHEISILKHEKTLEIRETEQNQYMKGLFYLVSGNYDQAIDKFRKVINENPHHFAAKVRLNEALTKNTPKVI